MRTQIEAELLLQNLILMLQAMGLGGWIHASIAPTMLLPALGFQYVTPRYRLLDFLRWGTVLTKVRDAADRPAAAYPMHVPAVLSIHGGRGAGGDRRQI